MLVVKNLKKNKEYPYEKDGNKAIHYEICCDDNGEISAKKLYYELDNEWSEPYEVITELEKIIRKL